MALSNWLIFSSRIKAFSYVRLDSSISNEELVKILASAGIRSPLENLMTSPGTKLLANSSRVWPSLNTWHCGGASLLRASSESVAWYSWTNETMIRLYST